MRLFDLQLRGGSKRALAGGELAGEVATSDCEDAPVGRTTFVSICATTAHSAILAVRLNAEVFGNLPYLARNANRRERRRRLGSDLFHNVASTHFQCVSQAKLTT